MAVPSDLGQLDTCVIADAMDSVGLNGVLPGFRLVAGRAQLCGPIVTVTLGAGPAKVGQRHLGAAAIDRASPGDVIVVDNDGRLAMGAWGGLLSVAAVQAGVGGVVVNGACRDVDEIETMELSVFAKGTTPVTARGRVHERATGEPTRINDVTVRSGDILRADRSGVVVLPVEAVEEIVSVATELAGQEREMIALLQSGETATDVLGHRYERMVDHR